MSTFKEDVDFRECVRPCSWTECVPGWPTGDSLWVVVMTFQEAGDFFRSVWHWSWARCISGWPKGEALWAVSSELPAVVDASPPVVLDVEHGAGFLEPF